MQDHGRFLEAILPERPQKMIDNRWLITSVQASRFKRRIYRVWRGISANILLGHRVQASLCPFIGWYRYLMH